MHRIRLSVLALALVAAGTSAQQLQTLKPMAVQTAPAAQAAQVDQDALARRKLETDNRRLQAENEKLRQENAALNARIVDFTKLGGSEVHAYCAGPTTSRNTAGAENDCSTSGGYTCEPVSGLCRTSCQTSDMCAGGYTCDTSTQQCVYTAGG